MVLIDHYDLEFYNFLLNIAEVCISAGILLIFIYLIRRDAD